jgi:hypothetical protein
MRAWERARYWYEQVKDKISDADRVAREKRFDALPKPAGPKPTGPNSGIDLLPMADARREGGGTDGWRMEQGALVSPRGTGWDRPHRVVIRYEAPDEYDLEMKVARGEGEGPIMLRVRADGRMIGMGIDGREPGAKEEPGSGFCGRDGNSWSPGHRGGMFTDHRPHDLRVEVRRNGIRVLFDGELLMTAPALETLGPGPFFMGGSAPTALMIASINSSFRIGRLVLVPRSAADRGKPLPR